MEIQNCPQCKVRVQPKASGQCPACQSFSFGSAPDVTSSVVDGECIHNPNSDAQLSDASDEIAVPSIADDDTSELDEPEVSLPFVIAQTPRPGDQANRRVLSTEEQKLVKQLRDQLGLLGCLCLISPAYLFVTEDSNNLAILAICFAACVLGVFCFQNRVWAAVLIALFGVVLYLRWAFTNSILETHAIITVLAAFRSIQLAVQLRRRGIPVRR